MKSIETPSCNRFGNTTRKTSLAVIDQAVLSGSNFFTTVIIGRYCGLEQLGFYSLAFTLLILLSVAHEALVWTPYMVFKPRLKDDQQDEYVTVVLLMQALITAAGLVILMITGGVIAFFKISPGFNLVIAILTGIMPFYLFREFIRRRLLAYLNVSLVLLLDVLTTTIQISCLVLLVWKGKLSAATGFASIGFVCAITSIGWFFFASINFTVQWESFRQKVRRHLSYGRWICISQLTDVTHNYALHWILAVFIGTAATGVFTACWSIVLVSNPLILGISNVLIPSAAQVYAANGNSELRRRIWKTTLLLGTTMSILFLGLAFWGDSAVRFLYAGSDYGGYGHIITILALTALISALSFAANQGLLVIERPDLNFKIRVKGLIVTLVVAVILIGHWGILGAAIGCLAGAIVVSPLQCFAFARLTRHDARQERLV